MNARQDIRRLEWSSRKTSEEINSFVGTTTFRGQQILWRTVLRNYSSFDEFEASIPKQKESISIVLFSIFCTLLGLGYMFSAFANSSTGPSPTVRVFGGAFFMLIAVGLPLLGAANQRRERSEARKQWNHLLAGLGELAASFERVAKDLTATEAAAPTPGIDICIGTARKIVSDLGSGRDPTHPRCQNVRDVSAALHSACASLATVIGLDDSESSIRRPGLLQYTDYLLPIDGNNQRTTWTIYTTTMMPLAQVVSSRSPKLLGTGPARLSLTDLSDQSTILVYSDRKEVTVCHPNGTPYGTIRKKGQRAEGIDSENVVRFIRERRTIESVNGDHVGSLSTDVRRRHYCLTIRADQDEGVVALLLAMWITRCSGLPQPYHSDPA